MRKILQALSALTWICLPISGYAAPPDWTSNGWATVNEISKLTPSIQDVVYTTSDYTDSSGNVQPGVGICPQTEYVGETRFGAGYKVGDKVALQDGTVIQVTGLKNYTTSSGTSLTDGIDTFSVLKYGSSKKYLQGDSEWSNWSRDLSHPYLTGDTVTTYACFIINHVSVNSTTPVMDIKRAITNNTVVYNVTSGENQSAGQNSLLLSDTTGMKVGDLISAPGITDNSLIFRIDSDGRVYFSPNTTKAISTGSPVTVVDVTRVTPSPQILGVNFNGSSLDASLLQTYRDRYMPVYLKVDGSWPSGFSWDTSGTTQHTFIDYVTDTDGRNIASDGDVVRYYDGSSLGFKKTDMTTGFSQESPVVRIERENYSPFFSKYYASGETSDTPILTVKGLDKGVTGQLKAIDTYVDTYESKGFVSQTQDYAMGGTMYGKSGHWSLVGGYTDATHEPASEGSWENTQWEIDMSGSGRDSTKSLYNAVDYAGRQGFVFATSSYGSPSQWSSNTKYTAKYDFYGVYCQPPSPDTNNCLMYNPDHSDHIGVTLDTDETLTGVSLKTSYGSTGVEIWTPLTLQPTDTLTITIGNGNSMNSSNWSYAATGITASGDSSLWEDNPDNTATVVIHHHTPYIFRAVPPPADDNLQSSKADYVASSGTTPPDWSKHLDGAVFPEQVDSSGNAVSGTVYWQFVSDDNYEIGNVVSLRRNDHQYYGVGWGSNAQYLDAAIDISGSIYRNDDGLAAQMRFNDRVPAIDFTACGDATDSATGEGCKNLHTLGYSGDYHGVVFNIGTVSSTGQHTTTPSFILSDNGTAIVGSTVTYATLPTSRLLTGASLYCSDCYSKLREDSDTQTGVVVYWNGSRWNDSMGIAIMH